MSHMGDIHIELPRRPATVMVNEYWSKRLNMQPGVVPCHVLGLFQYTEGDDAAYPVFVCELNNGHNIESEPTGVVFVDTKEGALCD